MRIGGSSPLVGLFRGAVPGDHGSWRVNQGREPPRQPQYAPYPCRESTCKTAWQSCGKPADYAKDEADEQTDCETCDDAALHVECETEAQADHQVSDEIWACDADTGCQAGNDAESETPRAGRS
jgi:hypothetical protein